MPGLSGFWVLEHGDSDSQKALMRAMGRKPWEVQAVDGADEEFLLLLHRKPGEAEPVLAKHVHIFLKHTVLRMLALVGYDRTKVDYHNLLPCGRGRVPLPDDEKGFGPCDAETTWDPARKELLVRWHLRHGRLEVRHRTEAGGARMRAEMCWFPPGGSVAPSARATKVYSRQGMRPEDWKLVVNKELGPVDWRL